jgi:hypothetical protein
VAYRTVEFYSNGQLINLYPVELHDYASDEAFIEKAKEQVILQYGRDMAERGEYHIRPVGKYESP